MVPSASVIDGRSNVAARPPSRYDGASGARVFNTLVYEMRRRGAKKGLATLCIGGGMGVAMCVEAM